MSSIVHTPGPRPVVTQTLTVRGTITTSGHSVEHVQYLAETFVVTELGAATILHSVELGGRLVVDRERRLLRRVDPATQAVQIAHLRELVGTVSIHRDPEPVELDGFVCRRYRLCNDSERIVVAAEAYCARVEAVGRTALHEERAYEARLHPFTLPLEPDELVIRSNTRTFSNGFQHTQSYRHEALAQRIGGGNAFEEFLRFPVVET